MEGVSVIIPAAGESQRMGAPKMILPFGSTTVLGRVIETVKSCGISDIIVVLGAGYEEIMPVVNKYNTGFCLNTCYKKGMLSSIICGLDHIKECSSFLVFPGDMPLVSALTVSELIVQMVSSGKGIIVPLYQGKRGHPVLINIKYRSEIRELNSNDGLRSLLNHHPDDLLEVGTDDAGILKDLDTYNDYLNEINQYRKAHETNDYFSVKRKEN